MRKLAAALVLAFLCAQAEAGTAATYEYAADRIKPPRAATDFVLTGPDGKPYSLKSLRGKFVLLAFGFTHCPNVCPTTLANLGAAYDLLTPSERQRVQVIFVTIDPARDTPALLKDYVPFFNPNFIGLTGRPAEIEAVARSFGIEYEKTREWGAGGNNYTMDHTAGAMLISPTGQWIGIYAGNQLGQHQRIADDLRHFMALRDPDHDLWQSQLRGSVKAPPLSGAELYLRQCASCHGEKGEGVAGKYRGLVNSEWVSGPPNRLTALVLGGVRGTEKDPNRGVMPAWWRVLPPGDVAEILTYIRQAWGHRAPAISQSYVQELAYKYATRPGFWSWKELRALPADKASAAAGL